MQGVAALSEKNIEHAPTRSHFSHSDSQLLTSETGHTISARLAIGLQQSAQGKQVGCDQHGIVCVLDAPSPNIFQQRMHLHQYKLLSCMACMYLQADMQLTHCPPSSACPSVRHVHSSVMACSVLPRPMSSARMQPAYMQCRQAWTCSIASSHIPCSGQVLFMLLLLPVTGPNLFPCQGER